MKPADSEMYYGRINALADRIYLLGKLPTIGGPVVQGASTQLLVELLASLDYNTTSLLALYAADGVLPRGTQTE